MKASLGASRKWPWVLCFILLLALLAAAPAAAATRRRPVRVKANAAWVDSKAQVTAGEKVNLKTKGVAITAPLRQNPNSRSGPAGQSWNMRCGEYVDAPPPCALNNAPYGALVGKIGDGTPFLIGASKSFIAAGSGTLWLAVNDNLNFYEDNKGGFIVIFK